MPIRQLRPLCYLQDLKPQIRPQLLSTGSDALDLSRGRGGQRHRKADGPKIFIYFRPPRSSAMSVRHIRPQDLTAQICPHLPAARSNVSYLSAFAVRKIGRPRFV